MKKVFITGLTGFAGSFLAECLLSEDTYEIFGTYITKSSISTVSHIREKLRLLSVNLVDFKKTYDLVKTIKPDIVFHLAALASPSESFDSPSETITNNIAAQTNLLEALRRMSNYRAKILVVSSAEVYGQVRTEDLPIDEQTPLRPTSPYAVSKMAQDFLGLSYFLAYGLEIVRVRPFNHIGPRQSPHFVVASFCKQIAEIEKGLREPKLVVGNLEAKRDFTDVRDTVRSYSLLIKKGVPGEVYNIGSGKSYKISEILDMLLLHSSVKITVRQDLTLLRPSDIPDLQCDNSKLKAVTGWEPSVPIERTLKDTLDYWRNIV